jgi:DNA modification methylase
MSEDFPALILGSAKIFLGDCRDALKLISDNSIDSIATDPPYELGFMGKKWDSSGIAYDVTVWQECLRVLKPGGHILAFGGSRTYHRLGVAIEDAGFEIRDTIAWISSKTFPKSLNVEKAMNRAGMDGSVASGWGTGLKQVVEPVVMARKPLDGTVAENTLRWGVGGINIDASRIATQDSFGGGAKATSGFVNGYENDGWVAGSEKGRWPANVILDKVSARLLDEQSGVTKSQISNRGDVNFGHFGGYAENEQSLAEHTATIRGHSDTGGASRFFYVAKASKRDRNEGIEIANFHPTVKPTALMCYLIKLVTPPGGTVLDPFTGSGSTGKAALLDGFNFIGVELTEEYLPIIKGRLKAAIKEKERDNDGLF